MTNKKFLFNMGESGVLGISYKLELNAKMSGSMEESFHIDMQDAIFFLVKYDFRSGSFQN